MSHYLYEARLTATEWAMPYFLQCAEGVHRENNSISMGKRKSLVSNQVAFWSSITTVVLKNSGHPGACPAGLRRWDYQVDQTRWRKIRDWLSFLLLWLWDPVLSTLHVLAYLIAWVTPGRALCIPILQIKQLRLRDIRKLANTHRTRKVQCLVSSAHTVCPSSTASLPRLYFFISCQTDCTEMSLLVRQGSPALITYPTFFWINARNLQKLAYHFTWPLPHLIG